jgi:hypothetical protein
LKGGTDVRIILKIYLKGIVCEAVNWIELVLIMITVMNL